MSKSNSAIEARLPYIENSVGTLHDLPLVSGEFGAEEARECVVGMINEVLKHQVRLSMASKERLGIENLLTEQRILSLSDSMDRALRLVEEARLKGGKIKVESVVKVSIV